MAIIDIPAQNDTSDGVREIFEAVRARVGVVPKPTRLLGTSPALLKSWWGYTKHFLGQPVFSQELLTHIRLLASVHGDFPFCVEFNTTLLMKRMGIDADAAVEIIRDPTTARLVDRERALLLFVLRVVSEPETLAAADVQALRERGWTDEQIFEAAYYGAWMLLLGRLFTAFKMHEE